MQASCTRGLARVAVKQNASDVSLIELQTVKVLSDASCVQSLAVKTTSAFDSPKTVSS